MKNEDDEVEKFVMANTQGSNSIGQLMPCFITMIPIFLVASFKPKYFPTELTHLQELGKDKWLCPLSGKKFKGPDFVRKHIFNKHGEKIEEVKKEVSW